jgi:hypothetical protein
MPPGVPVQAWQQLPPGMRMAALPYRVEARPHGFALAGLGPRLVARLLDIVAVLCSTSWSTAGSRTSGGRSSCRSTATRWTAVANGGSAFTRSQGSSRMDGLLWAMLIVATLLWLLYEAPAIAGSGQTLGKRIMRIKVVALENTEPLGFGRAFGRWARLGLWTPGLGLRRSRAGPAVHRLAVARVRPATPAGVPRQDRATVVIALPPHAPRDARRRHSEGHPPPRQPITGMKALK